NPWYILTSLSNPRLVLSLYKARWGIETMFKDCKTGGYNLEKTRVNERRLLATICLVTIAYSLATLQGECFKNIGVIDYIARPTESKRSVPRHSDFWLGLYGTLWVESMEIWSDIATELINLKPHKHLNFIKGMQALSLIQSTL
ncbi:MAG: transposase, partial [Moorea sp. SIO2I5]|nr:transposase [Moorena sp. SIO2I5]